MNENKIVTLKSIKLILLGDHAVGKTCICNSLMGMQFEQNTLATIGYEKIEKAFKVENGKEIKVIIYDTASQERFHSEALTLLKNVHGIILIFDVTHRDLFDYIVRWIKDIKENIDKPNIVLFGNKADIDKSKWQVTEEEVANLTQKYNIKYFETSAKTNMNINEGFNYIVNILYNKFKEKTKMLFI